MESGPELKERPADAAAPTGPPPPVASKGGADEPELGQRVAGASTWSAASMGGMLVLRFGFNILLARLLVPEQFGLVALVRICLIGVEQLSDVGIRGSVIYHERGAEPGFLNTAWTLQIVRGVVMWLACCAIAVPMSGFYEMPMLAWLLPVAGLEAINNGLLSVGIYRRQRQMKLSMPVLLEWIGLLVNLATTITWALISPTVWALVAGPVVGGVFKTSASHLLLRDVRLRPQWDRAVMGDLMRFGKWVFLGTFIVFVAQQFDRLYLGKLVPPAILGVYQVAWNFISQGTRMLTVVSNTVLTPLFAQYGRTDPATFQTRTRAAVGRFLPFVVLVCVPIGLVCPALFGYLYPEAFEQAGLLGQHLAVVVWFMILQQVPRTALLAVGDSRSVAAMSFFNAIFTVVACVLGFQLGSTKGLILGNAVGNLVGCLTGALAVRRHGLRVLGQMAWFTCLYLLLTLSGVGLARWMEVIPGSTSRAISLGVTSLAGLGLLAWVWQTTVKDFLVQRRGGGRKQAGSPGSPGASGPP